MKAIRRILQWDEALFLWVSRWQRPWGVKLMRTLTHFGDSTSWFIVAFILLAIGLPQTRSIAWHLGTAAGLAAAIAHTVKRVSKRRRPDIGIQGFKALVMNPDAFSFPSGHTACAFAIAVAVMGHGAPLGALLSTLAFGIAFSRVYLGAHYPLDVSAGAVIGVVGGIGSRLLTPILFGGLLY